MNDCCLSSLFPHVRMFVVSFPLLPLLPLPSLHGIPSVFMHACTHPLFSILCRSSRHLSRHQFQPASEHSRAIYDPSYHQKGKREIGREGGITSFALHDSQMCTSKSHEDGVPSVRTYVVVVHVRDPTVMSAPLAQRGKVAFASLPNNILPRSSVSVPVSNIFSHI